MKTIENEFLNNIETISQKRKEEILSAKDNITIIGTTYYVSADGNDENDGKTPSTAWKTLSKVSSANLLPGDGVAFRRNDTFRGCVNTKEGVSYFAYGEGDKPKLYAWDKNLADPSLWQIYDKEHNIWKLNELILDCGTLVFNEGEAHSRKLIPSYKYGKFVCRDNESKDFVLADEMTCDLDLFCSYTERMTTYPSKGENFPVPVVEFDNYGDLYLRCDKGNPGEIFTSIEALAKRNMFTVKNIDNVKIDNICMKYIGAHAIAAGGKCCKGLHVTNCEIGWIGGTIQNYLGVDPNYPEGMRGSVTRYGNGVEIYGGCDDYLVKDCYIYQCYDAGITHQYTTRGEKIGMTNIRYLDNLVEYCVYSIEYFLEKINEKESYIEDCVMAGNILRHSGYGWGQQRHNTHTPAHIKGWSYENTASNYVIYNNIFDRAAYRMLHLVAKYESSLPYMCSNTYIQNEGMMLGQYGANEISEPEILPFDSNAEQTIYSVLKENNAKVCIIKK